MKGKVEAFVNDEYLQGSTRFEVINIRDSRTCNEGKVKAFANKQVDDLGHLSISEGTMKQLDKLVPMELQKNIQNREYGNLQQSA